MTGGSLTRADVAAFERDGFLAPVPALQPAETACFLAALDELEEAAGGPEAASLLVQPQLHYAWAYELATHPVVLDAVESLIGPDILVHSTSIFSKGAESRAQVDWHQDGAYWALDTPAVVSAWIALTGSTPANGCLRVIPGSHRRGVVPFTDDPYAEDQMLQSGLRVAEAVDENAAVDLVLRPGQASLHHESTIHGSAANRSPTRRVGFAVRYVPPHARQPNHAHEVLLARGRDDHHRYRVRSEPPTASVAEAVGDHLASSEQALRQWMDSRRAGRPDA